MGSMPMGPAPPLPQQMQAQQGFGPIAARSMASEGGPAGPQGGQANPQGAIFARADAIKAVLMEMASIEPLFAPFARQAESAVMAGLSAVSAAPPQSLPEELPMAAPPGAAPAIPPLG
jgi:hypothetical protein